MLRILILFYNVSFFSPGKERSAVSKGETLSTDDIAEVRRPMCRILRGLQQTQLIFYISFFDNETLVFFVDNLYFCVGFVKCKNEYFYKWKPFWKRFVKLKLLFFYQKTLFWKHFLKQCLFSIVKEPFKNDE